MKHAVPPPIGEMYFFDIPALIASLGSLLTMDAEDFGQWQSGEHAAVFVDRVSRILQSVESRQKARRDEPQCTCNTPTRFGYCPVHESDR